MSTYPEPFSSDAESELPFPPAVTQRRALPLPGADDVVLMPPFSRAAMRAQAEARAMAASIGAPAAETPVLAVSAEFDGASAMPVAAQGDVARPLPVPTATPELPAVPDARQALADEVAARLEHMADDLRRRGFHALLEPRTEQEPIDAVLAAVIAGFLARR